MWIYVAAGVTGWLGQGALVARYLYPQWRLSKVPLCSQDLEAGDKHDRYRAHDACLAYARELTGEKNPEPAASSSNGWRHYQACYAQVPGVWCRADLVANLAVVSLGWPLYGPVMIIFKIIRKFAIMTRQGVSWGFPKITKIIGKVITGADRQLPAEREARLAELQTECDRLQDEADKRALDGMLDSIVAEAEARDDQTSDDGQPPARTSRYMYRYKCPCSDDPCDLDVD